jgi:16S rRNA (guanine527-N7)-methyltransferase
MTDTCRRIAEGALRFGVDLEAEQLASLDAYLQLLDKWNRTINLTALPLEPPTDETLDRLILEPLAASRAIPSGAGRWFDLGTGGGSPAIPLKILRPDLELKMVDSKERKGAFLREVVRTLQLPAAFVEVSRIEEFAGSNRETANLVTVRAVRGDEAFFQAAARLLVSGGLLLWFGGDKQPVPPEFSPRPLQDDALRGVAVLRRF